MNELWYTDGTAREEFDGRKEIPCRIALLEDDYRRLMRRVADMGEWLRYYNLKDEAEGYWKELFCYQPLIVLSEIECIDLRETENRVLRMLQYQPEILLKTTDKLIRSLEDWENRLIHYPHLTLSVDLATRIKFKLSKEKSELKKVFYSLLETIRKFQTNYELYLAEIRSCGENDPALALLDTFLLHYKEIAERYNMRWQQWPDNYFRKILHARFRDIVPDHVWLSFFKVPGVGEVKVEKGTAFVGGKAKEGRPVYYRTTEDVVLGDIKLVSVHSFFQEKDKERYPAAYLGFVTGISQNMLDLERKGVAQKLFGEASVSPLETGLMICSPMLLLREGKRKLTVTFYLTEESCTWFQKLLTGLAEEAGEKSEEIAGKLLKDAFLLDLTIESGWENVPHYLAVFLERKRIDLVFCLEKEFPATAAAELSLHGAGTKWPLLRIRMNPAAWLFPYSWMVAVKADRIRIHAEVRGVTALKVCSNIGELDTSVPFYPFGVQPVRGTQLVYGNYEMAVKPLQKVELQCKWLQLPSDPEGFYGYYRHYNSQIDNFSFRVKTEWLNGKKWKTDKSGTQHLFGSPCNCHLTATGPLPDDSVLSWHIDGEMAVITRREEEYVYGKSSSGFLRVVLESPEVGFGHSVYQTLFAEVMMENVHRKHPLPVPALPVSPLLESVEVNYEAEKELCFAAGRETGENCLFYIKPIIGTLPETLCLDEPLSLAEDLGKAGNLFLGFVKAVGTDRIRFFIDVAAIRQEIDRRDGGEADCFPVWYMKQKNVWCKLNTEALLRDTTGGFINSGLIELLLPAPVSDDWLDDKGIFWLKAQFAGNLIKQVLVKGIYTNIAEAVLDKATVGENWEWPGGLPAGTIVEAVKNIPGVADICQITTGKGGRKKEDREVLNIRMVHRIRHRHRAVTPRDFEDLVLEHFLQIAKVKCLSGLDSKGNARAGVVTLVVVPAVRNKTELPLCTHELLSEIECFLQPLTSAFVVVDAINPLYEEIRVRCNISLLPGESAAEIVLRLKRSIDELIAPWRGRNNVPVFGYRFALQELKNRIMEDKGVAVLNGLSVIQVCRKGEKRYRLNEFKDQGNLTEEICASCVWGIPIPAAEHLIRTDGIWQPHAGIGEVGVGETFIVGGNEE